MELEDSDDEFGCKKIRMSRREVAMKMTTNVNNRETDFLHSLMHAELVSDGNDLLNKFIFLLHCHLKANFNPFIG